MDESHIFESFAAALRGDTTIWPDWVCSARSLWEKYTKFLVEAYMSCYRALAHSAAVIPCERVIFMPWLYAWFSSLDAGWEL